MCVPGLVVRWYAGSCTVDTAEVLNDGIGAGQAAGAWGCARAAVGSDAGGVLDCSWGLLRLSGLSFSANMCNGGVIGSQRGWAEPSWAELDQC